MGIRSVFSKRRGGRTETPASKLLVRNQTRDVVVADSAQVADTGAKRRKGLLGRGTFENGEGLWITPCESIHTVGMKFPIDVVFLDRKKKVRKVRAAIVPWRISMCLLAHSVLELPAGTIGRTQTRPGDQLELVFISQKSQLAAEPRKGKIFDPLTLEV